MVKTARRGKSRPCLAASGRVRVQERGAHRENPHLATMSRRVTVLPQSLSQCMANLLPGKPDLSGSGFLLGAGDTAIGAGSLGATSLSGISTKREFEAAGRYGGAGLSYVGRIEAGKAWSAVGKSVAPYLERGGMLVTAAFAFHDAATAMDTDGPDAAAAQFSYSFVDAGVTYALSSTLVGFGAAVGYNSLGGSEALHSAAISSASINGCLATHGAPVPRPF
jgi:hypothetical protein